MGLSKTELKQDSTEKTNESKKKTTSKDPVVNPIVVLKSTMDCIADELVELGVEPDDIEGVEVLVSFSTKIKGVEQTFVMADSIDSIPEKEIILKIVSKMCKGKGIKIEEVEDAFDNFSETGWQYTNHSNYKRPQVIEKPVSEIMNGVLGLGGEVDEQKNLDLKSQMENFFDNLEKNKKEDPEKDNGV